jgi:sugar lactone lactonase YvrE
MKTFTAAVASTESYRLAEGPVWDSVRERVLWVDIEAGTVEEGEFRDGRVHPTRRRIVDETVGAVVCSTDNQLLVAGARTLIVLAPDGVVKRTIEVLPEGRRSRLNDGACDPAGRFLIGSLAQDDRQGQEILGRLEDDATITVIDDDLTVSNGLAWSPDGTQLYSVDTRPAIVWVRDYDPLDGRIGHRRELLRLTDGKPDGICLDVDGNLWIAMWGGGQVRCYSPEGVQLATVQVAAPHTSSVAFVGPDLDTLLITSASTELSQQQLDEFPQSGHLFTATVGVRGLPTTPWSGIWP